MMSRTTTTQRWLVTATAACAIIALAGCSPAASNNEGGGSGEDGYRVAFLNSNPDTTWGVAQREAAEKFAEENNITIDYQTAEYDPARQQSQCDTVVSSGDYDGLLIVPSSNTAAIPCATEAAEAGLAVVSPEFQIGPEFIADDIQIEGLDGQVYIDPAVMVPIWADMASDACAELGLDTCNVGLLTGDPEYPLEAVYLEQWDDVIKDHPDLKIVAELAPGFGAPNEGISATQNLLQSSPDVNIIMVSDDQTGDGVAAELERQGLTGKVLLIGQGGTANAVERIENGSQWGTLVNVPSSMSERGIEMLLAAMEGEEIDEPSVEMSQLSPLGEGELKLTKDNVEGYEAQY